MHIEPRTIFGMSNFINAAVDSCSRFTNKYRAALKNKTKQDMTTISAPLITKLEGLIRSEILCTQE